MSQQHALPRATPLLQNSEEVLSPLELETASLRKQLNAQDKLVTALEGRVGRSLAVIQTHLSQLTQCFENKPDWQKNLELMAAELHQLRDLLADATLLQKLEAGKIPVRLEVLELHPLLDAVSRHLVNSKDGKTARLICKIPSTLPPVHVDRELTEALLLELLGRAIKHSDSDSTIVLDATCTGSQVAIGITAQRFTPQGQRESAPETALCAKRLEVQGGKIAYQPQLNGFTLVTAALQVA